MLKVPHLGDLRGNEFADILKHDQYHMANPKFVRISIFKS